MSVTTIKQSIDDDVNKVMKLIDLRMQDKSNTINFVSIEIHHHDELYRYFNCISDTVACSGRIMALSYSLDNDSIDSFKITVSK